MSRQREPSLLYLCIAFAFFHCTHTTAATTNSMLGGSLVSFPMSSTSARGVFSARPYRPWLRGGAFSMFSTALCTAIFRGDGVIRARVLIAKGISLNRYGTLFCSLKSCFDLKTRCCVWRFAGVIAERRVGLVGGRGFNGSCLRGGTCMVPPRS